MSASSTGTRTRRLQSLLYGSYRHFWRNSQEFQSRCTPVGWILLSVLAASAAVGLDTNQSMAFQIFTLVAGLIMTGIIATVFFQPRLRVTRQLPRYAAADTPFTYRVTLHTDGGPVRDIQLVERLADPIPTREQFVNSKEPGEEKRNVFDRILAYYRWLWLVNRNELARPLPSNAVDVDPGVGRSVNMTLVPRRRGVIHLDRMRVLQSDPFGFIKAARGVRETDSAQVIVLPKRYPIPSTVLQGRSRYQPGGDACSSHIGQTEEYMGLREYRRGDPRRHIHWKSWARLGIPIVKEFEDEHYPRYALILDTFGKEDRDNTFEEAVSVAASFAYTLDTKESLLDLMFVGTEAYCYTSGRGTSQPEHLLEVLSAVSLSHEDDFESLRNLVISRARDLSTCICVFVTWDDNRRQLVRELRQRGCEIVAMVIRGSDPLPEEPAGKDGVRVITAGSVAEGLARL